MGENQSAIENKIARLQEEQEKDRPDFNIIKRLKDSIKRHKQIEHSLHYQRNRIWKKRQIESGYNQNTPNKREQKNKESKKLIESIYKSQ